MIRKRNLTEVYEYLSDWEINMHSYANQTAIKHQLPRGMINSEAPKEKDAI